MFEQASEIPPRKIQRDLRLVSASPHPLFRNMVTAHPEMHKIFHVVERVAATGSTVLILGESGSGKELIAHAVHALSGAKGNFIPVNCGAIPDNLLESELFGHEKGAFTGAISSKPGRFVMADGGTIFLDEIGEMSPHLQVKLLRVLQERVVEPVGGMKPRSVNVRVVAATHVNLQEAVKAGKFREDLFYRLQVVPIEVPALRERKSDIPLLAEFFSKRSAQAVDRRPLVFSPEVLQLFHSYNWPGNVRELENLIERLSILVDSDAVYPSDLPAHFSDVRPLQSSAGVALPDGGVDFNSVIEEIENSLILQALERTGGNKKAAAKLLNLNRTTLVEKIKKKGLAWGGDDRDDSDEGLNA